jgi:rhodanese-related sulfurtransferase
MKKNVSVLFLWVLFVFITPAPGMAAPEIDAAGVKSLMDAGNVTVIFPLSRIEFNDLHIPGSINLAMENIPAQLPDDKNRPLVFYCLGRS